MKIEYQNGVRLTEQLHELTPLEAMIQRYESLAKSHFENKPTNSSKSGVKKETDEQCQAQYQKAMDFLQREREKIETLSCVQDQLDKYREEGLKATQGSLKERASSIAAMNAESHHPTTILENYMLAEGKPKPSAKHTAHHIVPGKGKLQVKTAQTRMHLHRHGIRINDPANGVYLLHKDEYTPHWSMPKSRGHLRYHTHAYEDYVNQRVRSLNHIDMIKTQLQIIGRLLQQNEPKQAIAAIGALS